MNLDIKEFKELTGIKSYGILAATLARPEFSHITKTYRGRKLLYVNVYYVDIEKIKAFVGRRGKNFEEKALKHQKYKLLCELPLNASEEFVTKYLRKYCKM